jgi:Na+-translocating ferredoxin:NAD+ oxidoreductase RNF subunit RnfB
MFTKEIYQKVKAIYADAAVSTAAGVATVISSGIAGCNVLLQCTTGVLYASPLSTAPTAANAWTMAEGDELRINVPEYLAYMSTSTAAQRQMIVFNTD